MLRGKKHFTYNNMVNIYFISAGNPEYYNTVAYSQYNATPYSDPQWRAYPTGIISKCFKHPAQYSQTLGKNMNLYSNLVIFN